MKGLSAECYGNEFDCDREIIISGHDVNLRIMCSVANGNNRYLGEIVLRAQQDEDILRSVVGRAKGGSTGARDMLRQATNAAHDTTLSALQELASVIKRAMEDHERRGPFKLTPTGTEEDQGK